MKKRLRAAITLGKTVRHISRLRGSGGSALPGLVVERLVPNFLPHMLSQLPEGVVVVTGTNGKTTTTKMIADLLEMRGKRVLTNRTGSNFTRGIVATIVHEADLGGNLHYDIAVLELDEAYAKRFVQIVPPQYVVALNILRDQLDRFGEIDHTARLVGSVMQTAQKGCVVNADDPRLVAVAKKLDQPVHYYGVSAQVRAHFPTDEELHGNSTEPTPSPHADVMLADFDQQTATFAFGQRRYTEKLLLSGQYNFQNAAAALALLRQLCPDTHPEELVRQLAHVRPAFGRGETLQVNGQPLELVLVKNPAGFRQALASFATPAETMIAINDNYADGRDMSWLWDVDFSSLQKGGVTVVSGIRAYDMALRLQYDEVEFKTVEPKLAKALRHFVSQHPGRPKRVYCTYTAMLTLRALLKKHADDLEKIL